MIFNYNMNLVLLKLSFETKKPINFFLFNKNIYTCNFAIFRNT